MWYVWPARARRRSIRRSYTKGMWRGSVERGVNEAIHAPLADSRRRSVRTQIWYLPTDTVTFTNLPPVFQDTATGPSPHPPLFKGKGRAPEPLAGRAPAVPAAVPSAWPKAPSTASAPTTPSRTHAPAAPQQQRAAPSSDESCACTRARRRTREQDAAAGPRPAARVPAARRRRHHCSFAFARSVPDPRSALPVLSDSCTPVNARHIHVMCATKHAQRARARVACMDAWLSHGRKSRRGERTAFAMSSLRSTET